MKKLWEKTYTQHPVAEEYCFGDSAVADTVLVPPDVYGSLAHAAMLMAIGILTKAEFHTLKLALKDILLLATQGKFTVAPGDEDVHTKIENYLVKKTGPVGKKIHTGRSRNDQVLVDLKLITKEKAFVVAGAAHTTIAAFLSLAKKYEFVPMPGFTHMQKAMPSSVGMWAGSFAENLLDDLALLQAGFEVNDQNPLGSGAGYGVPLPLKREFTTKLLGFAKTQNNALACQSSRIKGQLAVMSALVEIMLTVSRFAEDLLLFTTSEFNFFTVAEEFSTGSSIMPQKKNLDVLELMRAKAQSVISAQHEIASIGSGLPSGYNADVGETKLPFMKSIDTTINSLTVVSLILANTTPNTQVLTGACTPELYATHKAYTLVTSGMPFRDAYKKVGLSLGDLPQVDVIAALKQSVHTGGTGNLGLDSDLAALKKSMVWWKAKETYYKSCIKKLLKGGEKYEHKNKV